MPSGHRKGRTCLNSLRVTRDAVVASCAELGEERTRPAFGVHALGDAKARRRLDEIDMTRTQALRDIATGGLAGRSVPCLAGGGRRRARRKAALNGTRRAAAR